MDRVGDPGGVLVVVGDRVFICLPPGAALELGRSRGYIGPGLCAGRTGPLIKTVAALGGQTIAVDRLVTVDGRPLPHSEIHAADAAGRPLARYAGGVVPTGRLYLHSDFAGSYDSRYFGPVPVSGLLGFAEPVLTFTP
ncbi:MAG: conjugative transfer signal peptidase TraF [Acetobacteraceae bacterium]